MSLSAQPGADARASGLPAPRPNRAGAPTSADSAFAPRDADQALLAAVVTGDGRAWRRFSGRFRALIFAMAARAGTRAGVWLDPDALADIVQETLLRLVEHDFRRLHAYRPEVGTTVSTWIGLVAATTAQDYLRRHRRHAAELRDELVLEGIVCPASGPEAQCLERETRACAQRALESLSPRDQELLELLFVEALSAEEAATLMGIAINTVYSKKAKLIARLSARLAGS